MRSGLRSPSYSGVERFPIRTLASLTGINPVTLRAWERRYGLIRPLRTPKGHRLYTHAHVERVRRALAIMARGIQVSRVRAMLDDEAAPQGKVAAAAGPWGTYLDRVAVAVAGFDHPELERVYDEALSIYSIGQVTRLLLLPSLERLGERWSQIQGGIAEEHFLTSYVRGKLGARLQHCLRYASGPRLLAACAPGEVHELGLLLFALGAQEAGYQPIVLGANTPLEELAAVQSRARCSALVISSTIDPAPEVLDREVPALVRRVGVPVFLGGATAVRCKSAIRAGGAVALGCEVESAVRLMETELRGRR